MGRIDVILPNELEERLRKQVGTIYGARRGALTNAIIQAIEEWLINHPKPKEAEKE